MWAQLSSIAYKEDRTVYSVIRRLLADGLKRMKRTSGKESA